MSGIRQKGSTSAFAKRLIADQISGLEARMSCVVMVPVAESDLPDRMMTMRTWLDHQKLEPDTFRYTPDAWADGIFRVGFKFEHEAMAFAEAFGGQVVGELSAAVRTG
jgi:hypothetical protein